MISGSKRKTGRPGGYRPRAAAAGPWGKLALAGLILAVLLGSVGVAGLLAWKQMGQWVFFQITSIRIDGCVRIAKTEILAQSGVDVHSNLLALSPGKVRRRLAEHPWVESAQVRREWPSRLRITIRERRPLALLSLPDGLYYVDRQAEPFARALPPEDLDFPVITGLPAAGQWRGEQRQGLQRALALVRLAARSGVILPAQSVSEINVGAEGGLTLFMVSHPFPIHLGDGRELTRNYNRLVLVLNRLQRSNIFAETAAIDLDYLPDRVLVVR